RLTTFPAEALAGRARITVEDGAVQEGARRFRISGGESAVSLGTFEPVDISREANGDVMLLVTLKVNQAPGWAGLAMRDASDTLRVSAVELAESGEFVRYGLSLKCLRDKGVDVT